MGFWRKLGRVVAAPVVLPARGVRKSKEVAVQKVILGLVRHALTTTGGALAAQGLLSGGDVEAAVGAIMTLVGIVASIYDKRKAGK